MATNPNPNPNPNSDLGLESMAPPPVSTAPPAPGLQHRVSSFENSLHRFFSGKKRSSSQQHLLHMEQQLETCTSPRLRDPPPLPYPSMASRQNAAVVPCVFQMPLRYPRFTRSEYESMPEWRLDLLLEEYGLPMDSSVSLHQKREAAIGNFLWN